MNKLSKLTATISDGPWTDLYPVAGAVPVQPAPGQLGVMQLSPAGLILRVGKAVAAIDLSELISLLAPQLSVPTAAPAPNASAVPATAGPSTATKKT